MGNREQGAIWDLGSGFYGPWIMDHGSWIMDHGSWIMDYGPDKPCLALKRGILPVYIDE
jgi:hypothetical protein